VSSSVVHIIRRRKNRAQRKAHRDTQRRIWSILIGAALVILVGIPGGAAVGGAAFLYINATANLPDPGENPFAVNGTTTFYDRTGDTLIYTASSSDRPWVALDTLPPYVIAATLVSEDPDFLVTPPPGIETVFVKLWQNVLIATLAPDSTITGRLVRNAILSNSGSLVDQRTREIALVGEINRRYSAETILEWHLNTNDYANEAFGIEAAAQTYFGKRSVDLTLDEAALLAAIPTGHLRGAALDAFAAEPPGTDNPLLALPNVIATPHMGAYTDDATNAMGRMALADCLAVLRGEMPRYRVV